MAIGSVMFPASALEVFRKPWLHNFDGSAKKGKTALGEAAKKVLLEVNEPFFCSQSIIIHILL